MSNLSWQREKDNYQIAFKCIFHSEASQELGRILVVGMQFLCKIDRTWRWKMEFMVVIKTVAGVLKGNYELCS